MTTPNFRRGGKQAEEEAKRRNIGFARTPWLKMEDGDQIFLRLIDDSTEWISIDQHEFIPTKGAPADWKAENGRKWPATMGAVCRKDKAFREVGLYPDGCYICDHMIDPKKDKKFRPALRLYARAVEREQVIGTQEMVDAGKIPENAVGRRVGFRDMEVEEAVLDSEGKPTDKKEIRKKILVLRFGMKNFYGALQGFYDVHGKLTDRDLSVTRKGSDTETTYSIVPLDATAGHDLADPETKARYEAASTLAGIDLGQILLDQSSDDYYARFFDRTKEIPSTTKKKTDSEPEGAPAEQQAKPEARAADPEALRRMRDKVMGANPRPTDAEPAAAGVNFE